MQLLLILSNQLQYTVIVEVFDTAGLASGKYVPIIIISNDNMELTGDDYGIGPYNVTFSAGISIASLTIPIIDDNIFEGNEDFVVIFDSFLLPSNILLSDNNNQSTIIILDDECK